MGALWACLYALNEGVNLSSVPCSLEYFLTGGNILDFYGEMARYRRNPSVAGLMECVEYINDPHSFILTAFHGMSGLLTFILKNVRRKSRCIDS